jgi:hypothetical protein
MDKEGGTELDSRQVVPKYLEDAIRPAQEALQLSGADVRIDRVVDGIAYFRLTVADDACETCVLPDEFVESMLTESLAGSGISQVRLLDRGA